MDCNGLERLLTVTTGAGWYQVTVNEDEVTEDRATLDGLEGAGEMESTQPAEQSDK
jgi:hypothetical protein